ncbi:MAG TPA: histidine phosphatase family protein [Ruania sp.]|nr:histidine phosphatase family protein [Ruania sp.]
MTQTQTPMKRLTLVRHAQADHNALHDVDRALTGSGRMDAVHIGKRLEQTGVRPTLVLCSSATRARQTWEQMARAYDSGAEGIQVQFLDLLYGADVQEVLELLQGIDEATQDLLVIGHEPVTSAVTHYLAGPASQDAAALRVRSGMSTATAALLSYQGPWQRLDRHGAVLTGLATPRG